MTRWGQTQPDYLNPRSRSGDMVFTCRSDRNKSSLKIGGEVLMVWTSNETCEI